MKKDEKNIAKILEESDGLSFVRAEEKKLLSALADARPEGFALLAEEAKEALRKTYRERLYNLFLQSLRDEVRKGAEKYDPVGVLLGRTDSEALKKAAADVCGAAEKQKGMEEWLYVRYPLLVEYRERLYRNTLAAFEELLDRLIKCRKAVSEKLLDGRAFQQVTGLSTGGADMHRHGRTVIGVTTDAGTIYYKPHDCGLDAFYEEIVSRWFSDCSIAPKVLEEEGFGFVSALTESPVHSKTEVSEYFRHFGILTALFHGLGSNDMHMENIMACGDKPSAIDLETILNVRYGHTASKETPFSMISEEIRYSVPRIGVLPARIYRGPLVSPLYCSGKGIACLPMLEGKRVTVEGYEAVFSRGFSEGYKRMLRCREEIREMLEKYRYAAVRVLLRNTAFYATMRQLLYRPEALRDEEGQQMVYRKLCGSYTAFGALLDTDLSEYEWSCLMEGDIPYYCATLDGLSLCGEDPAQIVKREYYLESAANATRRFLNRLSEEEERFEQDMIRVAFRHAPLDVPVEKEETVVSEHGVDRELLTEALKDVWSELKEDAIRCSDGSLIWNSAAESLAGLNSCGRITGLSDAGAFAAALSSVIPEAVDAENLARECVTSITEDLTWLEKREVSGSVVLPTGLYNGFGSVIKKCAYLESADVEGAKEARELVIRVILEKKLYEYPNNSAAEGAAGLLIALASDPEEKSEELKACIRYLADRILNGLPAKCADLPYGNAGCGAALAAAAFALREPVYAEAALKAFTLVEEGYDENLFGWPDSKAKVKSLADRGPHAAGICLAAFYAKEKLSGFAGSEGIERVFTLAKNSFLKEKTLYHKDCLDQGNALTVLALLKAGEKEAAGKVLAAMIDRAKRKGCFTVTEPGIRSFFDPSFMMGTTGIGFVMAEYWK